MAFIPVLWNRPDSEFDDMFHLMEPWAPMVRSQRRRGHETSLADKKWTFGIKLGDFDPQHVKVKTENGKVIIHAKYTEGNDEWGDTVERKRTVNIPENVDVEKIHSHMRSDGTLILEAQYKEPEEKQLKVIPHDGGALNPTHNLMEFSVGNFKPEEIKISFKDGVLTATGERSSSDDGCEVRESFFRQMTVPKSFDVSHMKCFENQNGHLTICAPPKHKHQHTQMDHAEEKKE